MRFLGKQAQHAAEYEGLSYDKLSDRPKIRELLKKHQFGYCAYSERYFRQLDSCEIEHFNPNLKHTDKDGFLNWFAVHRWMNAHKSRKFPEVPLADPADPTLYERVKYHEGQILPKDENDQALKELITYLGVNKPEVFEERRNHVAKLQQLRELLGSEENFLDVLKDQPDNLSYVTALEAELDLDLQSLILGS